ncbi:MAG: hypothetical protein IPM53_00185 [Anaerolineaceae bacterium]|nr:hypothetical protein [Anaerolineaceae bacterium]
MSKTITALYENIADARAAVEALLDSGYQHDHISLVVPDPEGKYQDSLAEGAAAEGDNPRDTAAAGALAGTALGGLAGLLFGVSVFSLPVLGAAVLAGPIYTAIMGASAGGIGGGLLGWLVEKGVPAPRAHLQTEALRRGHILVAVEAIKEDQGQVTRLLQQHNALNIEEAAKKWRAGGWHEDDNPPDQYEPEEDDKHDQHAYATGAMDSDVYGRRERPPLPPHEEDSNS